MFRVGSVSKCLSLMLLPSPAWLAEAHEAFPWMFYAQAISHKARLQVLIATTPCRLFDPRLCMAGFRHLSGVQRDWTLQAP